MPSDSPKQECPFCHALIGPEAAPRYRPFSCPTCYRLIEPLSHYDRSWIPIWLKMCLVVVLGSLIVGLCWYLGLLGLALGVFLVLATFHLVRRHSPLVFVLGRYEGRTYTENLLALADFLEQIAGASSWTPELSASLEAAKGRRTWDDELENAAIELADLQRTGLQGIPPGKRPRLKSKLSPEKLLSDLRATADDLRLAAKM